MTLVSFWIYFLMDKIYLFRKADEQFKKKNLKWLNEPYF